MRRAWRLYRIALVVALLAVTAFGGISDGLTTWREASSPLTSAASAAQLAYGGLSVAALFAMAFRRRSVVPLLIAWAVALTAVGTVASVIWGEQTWAVGAAGGAATAVAAALVVAGWRAHARRDAADESLEPATESGR
jgi:hypothetical protein